MHIILQRAEPTTLQVQEGNHQTVLQICGTADQALEKLRISAIKFIEAHARDPTTVTNIIAVNNILCKMLTAYVDCFQTVLTSAVSLQQFVVYTCCVCSISRS